MCNENVREWLDEVLTECGIELQTIQKGDYLFIVHSNVDCRLLDTDVPINISQVNKWKRLSPKRTHQEKRITKRFDNFLNEALKTSLVSYVQNNQSLPISSSASEKRKTLIKNLWNYEQNNSLLPPLPTLTFEERKTLIKNLQDIYPNFFYTDDPEKLLGAIDRCIMLGDLVFEAPYGERGRVVYIDANRYF
jgi:hypothetical protein